MTQPLLSGLQLVPLEALHQQPLEGQQQEDLVPLVVPRLASLMGHRILQLTYQTF